MSAFLRRNIAAVRAILYLLLLVGPAVAAPVNDQVEARRKVVLEEQEALNRAQRDLSAWRETRPNRLATLQTSSVTVTVLEQARVDAEAARVHLESAEVDRQTAQRTVQELEAGIRDLEDKTRQLKGAIAGKPAAQQARAQELRQLQDALAQKTALLAIEEQHLNSRQAARSVAEERLAIAEEWLKAVEELYRAAQEQNQQVALEELQARLEKEQQEWLAKAEQLRRELARQQGTGPAANAQRRLLETRAQDADERARLTQSKLRLAQIESRIDILNNSPLTREHSPEILRAALDQLNPLVIELTAIQSLLNQKIAVLQQQQQVIAKRAGSADAAQEEKRLIERLIHSLQQQIDEAASLSEAVKNKPGELQTAYDESVRRGLLAQRELPTDAEGWSELIQDVLALPSVLAQKLWTTAIELGQALGQLSPDRWVSLLLAEFFWLGATRWLRTFLAQAGIKSAAVHNYLATTLTVLLHLGQRTLPGATVGGALLILLWMAHPPEPGFTILLTLVAGGLSVMLLIDLAWALLVSPPIAEARRRPALYRQLSRMLLIGGVLTGLILLGHSVIDSTPLRNFIDRLFMLFLTLFALPVLDIRRLMLRRLTEQFGERYWMRIARLLSLLVPVSLLAGAAVGLAGYINLAWTVAKYLGSYLLALALWLVLSRLTQDLAAALKSRADQRSRHGALWAQGFIDPALRIGRAALFVLLLLAPVWIYGGGAESPVIRAVGQLLEAQLFTVGNAPIHLQDLLLTVLAVLIVLRLGRWARLITYRWALSGISDPGTRHSISVFAQYAVVLIGLLITLRVIGIDLTTLAIFAGALGVGIGFGLQTIANNFISGILLLIERPLRTSDMVRIGEYEGEVTQIGMRSLTLRTPDNQEVIIPNSEVISNAFTNWTHSDNIVRTIFTVGVSYDADPYRAREAIFRALHRHPSVLADPDPCVWLQEFADSSINFQVQYYVDLSSARRLEVKSDVLFNIWDELKEAGIEIPYPKRDIYIKTSSVAAEALLSGPQAAGAERPPNSRSEAGSAATARVRLENYAETGADAGQEESSA